MYCIANNISNKGYQFVTQLHSLTKPPTCCTQHWPSLHTMSYHSLRVDIWINTILFSLVCVQLTTPIIDTIKHIYFQLKITSDQSLSGPAASLTQQSPWPTFNRIAAGPAQFVTFPLQVWGSLSQAAWSTTSNSTSRYNSGTNSRKLQSKAECSDTRRE